MASDAEDAAPLRLCILGGSLRHPGGLEAYCERAQAAIADHLDKVAVVRIETESAYLGIGQLGQWLAKLAYVWRQRGSFDLVWLQVSNLPDLAFLVLLRLARKRFLVTPHFGSASPLQTRAWRRMVCKRTMALADRIGLLFDSQPDEIDLPVGVPRETIGTFLPRSSFVLRGPGDVRNPVLRLIHAARFSEGKGSFAMVELCAMLKAYPIPFTARLVGRADERTMDALLGLIAAKGLESDIEITPWVNEQEMAIALNAADVLVHLSRLDSFPLIVLEAQAADTLPLICSMRGADAMVAAYGGHVAAGPDPVDAAARWLAETSLDHIRSSGQIAGARVRMACSWSGVVANLAQIFSRTLAGEAGGRG